ncbi:MAG: 16S rRNA (cytidine(1402)-2'-O)-methyltransferase [Firmicutes bacterium]|nr:16S rRNA (cytidine(1402)-2'-O)-methyltransferase [Bacillota bacterium]
MSGTLYIVATPIGNLEDISFRALRILREVDIIAAEDTRVSRKLLNHFEIKKPLISYYEHNKTLREQALMELLLEGKDLALISDAGTPAISDPGQDLVQAAAARNIPVVVLPGASAMLTALVGSALDTGRFCFEGFLPRDKKERRERLQELRAEKRTMIFYEAPHRLKTILADMQEAWGAERRISAGRELTKLHEEMLRGTIGELCQLYAQQEPRGEYVLVVAGAEEEAPEEIDPELIAGELDSLLESGMPRKEAARILADRYGMKVRDIYQMGLKN